MVWAGGATTVAWDKMGKLTFNQTVFDADGEVGDVIDLHTYLETVLDASNMGNYGRKIFVPQYANLYLSSAHATAVTDVVSFKLQGSVDNLNWDDLCEVTDADVANGGSAAEYSDVVSATAFPTVGYRYFRLNCATVGAGNTLRGYVQLW